MIWGGPGRPSGDLHRFGSNATREPRWSCLLKEANVFLQGQNWSPKETPFVERFFFKRGWGCWYILNILSGRLYSYSKIFLGGNQDALERRCAWKECCCIWGCCRESGHPLLICLSLTTAQSNSYDVWITYEHCVFHGQRAYLQKSPSNVLPSFIAAKHPALYIQKDDLVKGIRPSDLKIQVCEFVSQTYLYTYI